jgi:hypothetical protein
MVIHRIAFNVPREHVSSFLNYLNTRDIHILGGGDSEFAEMLGLYNFNDNWDTILCEINNLAFQNITLNGIDYNGQLV